MWSHMHEQNSGDEAQSLAVTDFLIEQWIRFEHVIESQLSGTQLWAEVWMVGERSTWKKKIR